MAKANQANNKTIATPDNAPLERLNVMIRGIAKKKITDYQTKYDIKTLDEATEKYLLASSER